MDDEPTGRDIWCQTPGCATQITNTRSVSAERFHGRLGPATLYKTAINITVMSTERRELLSGVYDVADVCCRKCKKILGWYYFQVSNKQNEWKIGKYCLEDSLANESSLAGAVASPVVAHGASDDEQVVDHVSPQESPISTDKNVSSSSAAESDDSEDDDESENEESDADKENAAADDWEFVELIEMTPE